MPLCCCQNTPLNFDLLGNVNCEALTGRLLSFTDIDVKHIKKISLHSVVLFFPSDTIPALKTQSCVIKGRLEREECGEEVRGKQTDKFKLRESKAKKSSGNLKHKLKSKHGRGFNQSCENISTLWSPEEKKKESV